MDESRIRFGLILPSSNSTMEWEYQRLLPSKVSLHSSRVRLQNVTVESLFEMARDVERAARELADADVNLIAYGCTTGSLIGGSSYEKEIISRISGAAGVPALTTAGAVCDALKTLRVTSLSVATPYTDGVNKRERKFLEERGFKVTSMGGLGLENNLEIGRQEPEQVYALATQIFDDNGEVLFISCTNLRTIEVIERLERELKRPVVSSNTATLWKMLTSSNTRIAMTGCGRLLSSNL